jgi:hypothetical protein
MSFETDLQARLSGDEAIFALVDHRIFPAVAPPETIRPYCVYLLINKVQIYSHSGCSALSQFDVQISCYGDSYELAKQVAVAVSQALESWAGSEKIQSAFQIKEQDLYEKETQSYQVQVVFSIIYNEI